MAWLTQTSAEKFPHGDRKRYTYGKCRCEACREANAAYKRTYQATRKRRAGNPGLQK